MHQVLVVSLENGAGIGFFQQGVGILAGVPACVVETVIRVELHCAVLSCARVFDIWYGGEGRVEMGRTIKHQRQPIV